MIGFGFVNHEFLMDLDWIERHDICERVLIHLCFWSRLRISAEREESSQSRRKIFEKIGKLKLQQMGLVRQLVGK